MTIVFRNRKGQFASVDPKNYVGIVKRDKLGRVRTVKIPSGFQSIINAMLVVASIIGKEA